MIVLVFRNSSESCGVVNYHCIPLHTYHLPVFYLLLHVVRKKNVYLRFQIFISNVQTFLSGFNSSS